MTPDDYRAFWVWMFVAFFGVLTTFGLLFLWALYALSRFIVADAIRQIVILLGRG